MNDELLKEIKILQENKEETSHGINLRKRERIIQRLLI